MSGKFKCETYMCPRCNYISRVKKDINQHLYNRKTACPDINGLELTDEIKQIVIQKRRYHPPKKETIVNNINNFNMMINLVNGLSFEEKIIQKPGYVLEYTKLKILDIEDGLEHRFKNKIKRLESKRGV